MARGQRGLKGRMDDPIGKVEECGGCHVKVTLEGGVEEVGRAEDGSITREDGTCLKTEGLQDLVTSQPGSPEDGRCEEPPTDQQPLLDRLPVPPLGAETTSAPAETLQANDARLCQDAG